MTNIIFFGSPDFSAQVLESLIQSDFNLVGVVTNPDKPTGRKQILTPSSVAQVAAKHHLPTFKPAKLDDSNLAHLKLLNPDIFLVVAFGKIIPPNWLQTPKIASLNLHFSLLPKYRGALCLQQALKNGDPQTGVTLMEMDEQLDHGPVISQATQEIDLSDDVASLQAKLTQLAIKLLQTDLPKYLNHQLQAKAQDHTQATYTPSLKTQSHSNAYIAWEEIKTALNGKNALKIHNLIRSLNPQPGAWTSIKNQELKLLKIQINQENQLEITSVQIPGKSPTTWKQYLSGHSLL